MQAQFFPSPLSVPPRARQPVVASDPDRIDDACRHALFMSRVQQFRVVNGLFLCVGKSDSQ